MGHPPGQTAPCYDADFYPYGGEIVHTNSCTTSQNYKFTGKERDTESSLDNFGARYVTSSFGRFMSPDNPFADQDRMNPQSWNLYGYVRNNPLRGIDPSGRGAKEFMEAVRNIVILTTNVDVAVGAHLSVGIFKFEAKSGTSTETKVRPFGDKPSETTTYVETTASLHVAQGSVELGNRTPFIDPKTGAIYGHTKSETTVKAGGEKGDTATASVQPFSNDHEIHVLGLGVSAEVAGGGVDLSLDTNAMSTAAKELPSALLEGGEAILNILNGFNPFAQEQSQTTPDIRSPLTCPTQPCQ